MKISRPAIRVAASALVLCGVFAALGACGNSPEEIGPAQSDPGPMGTTATPSQADTPTPNSQSTPIMKP